MSRRNAFYGLAAALAVFSGPAIAITASGPPGSTASNPIIPSINATGAFQYDFDVTAGQTYYVDPTAVERYIFAIGENNPYFASALLPAVQPTPYDVSFSFNGIMHEDRVLPGHIFSFPDALFDLNGGPVAPAGVSEFEVSGITVDLSPTDTRAFVVGLTFEGDGAFTGTQTPVVPEPSTWIMLVAGFAGLGFAGYRRARLARSTA